MNEDMVLRLHDRTVEMKQTLVRVRGPMSDLPPTLSAVFHDGQQYVGHPRSTTYQYIEETKDIIGCIAQSLRGLWLHKGRETPLVSAAMALEGYEIKGAGNVMDTLRRGTSLEDDFKYNPASAVSETLITCVIGNDAVGQPEVWSVKHPFTYSDGGVLVLGEPHLAHPNSDSAANEGRAHQMFSKLLNEIGRKP